MFKSLSLLLVCAVAFSQAAVPMTVYYETLCPFSIKFILDQLVPTYNDKRFNFAGLLSNLELVPYGIVNYPNFAAHTYQCQHGQRECDGNKLHGCAIKYIQNKGVLLNYLACLMRKTQQTYTTTYPANECRNLVPGNLMNKINACFTSNEGWEIFNQHGRKTNSFYSGWDYYFVPYIAFNNRKNHGFSAAAASNLRRTLCNQNGIRHNACN